MNKKSRLNLSPSIILALGILLATQASMLAAYSGAALIGPILLGLAVLCADGVAGHLTDKRFMPRPASLIMAGTFIVAGIILLPNGARFMQAMIPIMGITALLTSRQWTHSRAVDCAQR